MIKQAISDLLAGRNLDFQTTKKVMLQIMEGKATHAQTGALLAALRLKGETIDEITACVSAMREKCLRLNPATDVIDIVGTGGDGAFSFNISTITALAVAASGTPVAKHGGRSVSSKCGSADLLEALGINIMLSASESEKVLSETGICFMLAQVYHSAMKYVAPVRQELGVRTIFNILGPLANPAGANMQLLGVYDSALLHPLAEVLLNLGVKRAMVVNGLDGLDEITLTGPTRVCEIKNGKISEYTLTPEEFGFAACSLKDLTGGSPQENAQIALQILRGEKGPKYDTIVLNTACCLYIADKVSCINDGIQMARNIIDSGKAMAKLQEFILLSNKVAA